jgi:hypothetical protein
MDNVATPGTTYTGDKKVAFVSNEWLPVTSERLMLQVKVILANKTRINGKTQAKKIFNLLFQKNLFTKVKMLITLKSI